MVATKVVPLTNKELGDAIGIHHSMASRIRNGKRLPGVDTIGRISAVYGIPEKRLLDARKKGEEAFGRLITKEIVDKGLRP